jgi:hypothetical protein
MLALRFLLLALPLLPMRRCIRLGSDRRGKEPSSDFRDEAASVLDERVRRWVDEEVEAVEADDLAAFGEDFIRRLAAMVVANNVVMLLLDDLHSNESCRLCWLTVTWLFVFLGVFLCWRKKFGGMVFTLRTTYFARYLCR